MKKRFVLCPHGDECPRCRTAQRRGVASLCVFGEDEAARIEAAAAADDPPERWLTFVGTTIESRAWIEWHRYHGARQYVPGRKPGDALRDAVIARDGYVCGICRQPTKADDVHIDHVVPFARGGPTVLGNLRVTHSLCNLRKGASL